MQNAAESLVGVSLDDGWKVVEKINLDHNGTGGNFCFAYRVQNSDGRKGFLKALDYSRAFQSADPARALQELTSAYNFERDILDLCEKSRMSKIVLALGHGTTRLDGFPIPNVDYLIFEEASGDVRRHLARQVEVKDSVRLRIVHHIALGISQLHSKMIAHQDLKPSNVLIFNDDSGTSGKIGDLGRATSPQIPSQVDSFDIAGDPTYAPPEQQYRATPVDYLDRRLGCDVYQLGSMLSFMFTGNHINTLVQMEIYPEHNCFNWRGTYAEVLPYLKDTYVRVIQRIRELCCHELRDEIAPMIGYLCHPDVKERGHPLARRLQKNVFSLDRVVSKLDLLSRRMEIVESGRKV